MSKTYKGYELIKAILEGEIPNGSRFWITIYGNNCRDGCEVIYDGYELRWNTKTNNELKLTAIKLSWSIFELIEDNTIDDIKKLK